VTRAAHGDFYATAIRKLDHLYDVLGRARFENSHWPTMYDLSEVRGGGLPSSVVGQERAAKVLEFLR
jgi:hypothetical protein